MIQPRRLLCYLLLVFPLILTIGSAAVHASTKSDVNVAISQSPVDIQHPDPPVLFLHYDYMAAPWWDPAQGNFAPDAAAIERVVETFRKHGITLVIDRQHTEIPYRQYLVFGPTVNVFGGTCPNTVCVNFYDLKNDYFHPRGSQSWHYAIFGDVGINPDGERVGGMAELPGYDFMVTIPFPHRTLFLGTQLNFWQDRVSGAFMHELGHNLGLRHGGDDDENYKLNYVSVMNYSYQTGILYAAPGDTYQFGTWFATPPVADAEHIAGIRLDYSDSALPTLDEFHLDEQVGVGGPVDSTDVTYYFACGAQLTQPCKAGYIRVAAAPFDWDNNGIIEADIAADINYVPNPTGELFLSRMRGYDDWTHVHNFLRTPQYVAGTLRPNEVVQEPSSPGLGLIWRP